MWSLVRSTGCGSKPSALSTATTSTSRYASSDDGLSWTWGETVLAPTRSGWDRRGRRVAAIIPRPDGSVIGYYDGRADAEENWYERTGVLQGASVNAVLEVASSDVT